MPFDFKDKDALDLHITLGVEAETYESMLGKAKAEGREVRGPIDHGWFAPSISAIPTVMSFELTASTGARGEIMNPATSKPHEALASWRTEPLTDIQRSLAGRRVIRLCFKLRRLIAKSWLLSRCYYRVRGARLDGRPKDELWYFAYGANMHDSAFRFRRGIQPRECRPSHIKGYQLRFNLEGRPKGKAAPANLCLDSGAEVWGVLYRITRRDLMRLDTTEGVPGRGYRHVMVDAKDPDGRMIQAVTYMARGKEVDGKPSLRYITLLRDGTRAHGLPAHYIRFLESVEHGS